MVDDGEVARRDVRRDGHGEGARLVLARQQRQRARELAVAARGARVLAPPQRVRARVDQRKLLVAHAVAARVEPAIAAVARHHAHIIVVVDAVARGAEGVLAQALRARGARQQRKGRVGGRHRQRRIHARRLRHAAGVHKLGHQRLHGAGAPAFAQLPRLGHGGRLCRRLAAGSVRLRAGDRRKRVQSPAAPRGGRGRQGHRQHRRVCRGGTAAAATAGERGVCCAAAASATAACAGTAQRHERVHRRGVRRVQRRRKQHLRVAPASGGHVHKPPEPVQQRLARRGTAE